MRSMSSHGIARDQRQDVDAPGPEKLDGDGVRARCISDGTIARYRSYLKGIRKWVMANKSIANPQRFLDASENLDPRKFKAKDFEAFLVDKQDKLTSSTLGGYRSAMKDLYRRHQLPLPSEYGEKMTTLFSGLKRLEADRDQTGQGRETGKRPLTYSRYVAVCKSTLARNDGGFAHLFLTTQLNLMCRSKSVETIQTSHLVGADDSVGIVLHKTKTNQEGSGPKDPRHIYANPGSPVTCWLTALGVYLACHPRLQPGALFPCSNHKLRFGKALSQCIKDDSEAKFLGTHSIRKGVASYASGGSTGGPSIVSICLRCGWSLGSVQDRYFRYESAGDQYLGRVVAGLPLNNSKFSSLPPHFVDPSYSQVDECVRRTFPSLAADGKLRQTLQLCVAALVSHADFLRQQLPSNHALLSTFLFRDDSVMTSLKQQIVKCNSPWMQSTGIPPHIEIYKQLEGLRDSVKQLPETLLSGVENLLDEKGVSAGNITRDVLAQTIRQLLAEAGIVVPCPATQSTESPPESSQNVHFWGGKFHFLKADFEFPSTDPITAWMLWWFGNKTLGYPPLCQITSRDLSSRQKSNTLSEWKMFVHHITVEIEKATGSAIAKMHTEAEAEKLFAQGMDRLKLLPTIRARRNTQLKVSTLTRLIRGAMKADNPNALSEPFRKRKRAKRSDPTVG